jgi:glycosyltransferase involved in cell wall biosynthesis
MPASRPEVVYLTRNGLLEPLGQSQVLPYLQCLASDFSIRVVTFEKPEDITRSADVAAAEAICDEVGLDWIAHRFRLRPRRIAPAFAMLQLLGSALGPGARARPDLIHARSYVPAAVALAAKRLFGVPFIFDMRALWVEELLLSGEIAPRSLLEKTLRRLERACLTDCAAVVSLTEAAVDHLKSVYPQELKDKPIAVIPTCVDLDRFAPVPRPSCGPRIYGAAGTMLSAWFSLDWLGALFRAAARRDPVARFEIITRDDPDAVRTAIGGGEDLQRRLDVFPLAPAEMPEAVRRHSVSAMFFTDGLAKLGSSPTRMGEVLGSGIPVIANDAVGDVGRIVREWGVGVLMEDGSDVAAERALDALESLLSDPETGARCRLAAEAIFSLEAGCDAYRALYRDILGEPEQGRAKVPASVAALGSQD